MARIRPFKGYRYNPKEIDDMGAVMAPPYASISDEEKSKYYELHPYNAVRLVACVKDDTKPEEHGYEKAAQFLKEWIEKKILVQEPTDAVYLYEQAVTINREQYYNRGFVTLLELTDYEEGSVVLCEDPTTDTTQDRFEMVKALEANTSMVSCMYVDEEKKLANLITEISEEAPEIDFETAEGIRQRIWAITYQPTVEFIISCLKDKLVYIVDGHNRYEACLAYKKYREKTDPDYDPEASYNYTLAQLSDAHEDGRLLLPLHRLVKFPKGFREDYFVAGAQDHFKVEKIIVDVTDDELADTMRKQIATQRKETRIALYTGGDYFYRLILKDPESLAKILPEKSEIYRSLDIAVLNKLLLEDVLYITEDTFTERVSYTREAADGVKQVQDKEYGCMFMINPVRQTQVSGVALAGERLPKRSVCIFPKPATGVLIHKFEK